MQLAKARIASRYRSAPGEQSTPLTGSESADLEHHAQASSNALGRTIRYRDVPHSAWTNTLREGSVPAHLVDHLEMRAELRRRWRYNRTREQRPPNVGANCAEGSLHCLC